MPSRSLLDAARVIAKARSADKEHKEEQQQRRMRTRGKQKRQVIAATPSYLKRRVEREQALPRVALTPHHVNEQLRATTPFVLGLEEGGVKY